MLLAITEADEFAPSVADVDMCEKDDERSPPLPPKLLGRSKVTGEFC